MPRRFNVCATVTFNADWPATTTTGHTATLTYIHDRQKTPRSRNWLKEDMNGSEENQQSNNQYGIRM